MSNKSIFSYHNKPDCSYCRFRKEDGSCEKGSAKAPCEAFKYDVFKRTPREHPSLPQYSAEEFEI